MFLVHFLHSCRGQLEEVVTTVRQDLNPMLRRTISSLIVLDVHNRDIVTELCSQGVVSVDSFEWIVHLRYYWQVRGVD